jgi:hypothetical protein
VSPRLPHLASQIQIEQWAACILQELSLVCLTSNGELFRLVPVGSPRTSIPLSHHILLSGVPKGGTFHHAEFEFRIKGETATIDENREELERCLTALRNQLRSINRQAD